MCQFDPNDSYTSGLMDIDRHLFEDNAAVHGQRHESQLKALSSSGLQQDDAIAGIAKNMGERTSVHMSMPD